MSKNNVLIVDDDISITGLLQDILGKEYKSFVAADGLEAIKTFEEVSPDLVILDLKLPKMDGFEVCHIIRNQSQVPIIVLSGLKEQDDKLKAFELGADDYLTKPFYPRELIARTKALLRRGDTNELFQSHRFNCGSLEIDFKARIVTISGQEINLTPIEYKLLMVLVQNAGKVMEYNELLNEVWGLEYKDNPSYLHDTISNLRKKISLNTTGSQFIVNIPKVGYRFEKKL